MKKRFRKLAFLVLVMLPCCTKVLAQEPADLVNPLMGSLSKPELSNGNTYPAIALPWGMNFWTPQTGKMGDGWQYTYDGDKIRGFKQTHQPSPWMNDYGQFVIMAGNGKPGVDENHRASWFSHKTEISRPYYYSVYLAGPNITAELTPTERTAQFRFTYAKSDSSYIIIDALDQGSFIQVIPEKNEITGYSTKHAQNPLKNFRNYFVIYLDRPFTFSRLFDSGTETDSARLHSIHAAATIGFKTSEGDKVGLRVASSFISMEQAELNLTREQAHDSFDQTEAKAKAVWNKTLSRVEIGGGTTDQQKTFYSCLYRMLFFPNKLYELDKAGKIIHWSPYTGKTETGYMFAGTGFWDTFRALYPFLNLVYPGMNKEMQLGLINDYKEGGWLPEWSSPGYSAVMVGNNSASVVAEAYIKGLRGYNIDTLYQALLHGANNEGPRATGRKGVEYYNSLGYVPYDVKINENAARTLEYAYDDFSIYQLGMALKRPASETDLYKKRAMNYRNLFDKTSGLMRGRNKDGSFQSPFNPFKWGDAFTEGNSWHYTWGVFQDIQGLMNLMGGRKAFIAKLDSVFILPPVFDDSYYGEVIHEIREMQIAGMGQYAHGNQPIQHMIYLYGYGGEPWKTQFWARETMNKLYKATPDGYCGDEDNGQTSAWYVFSALGFYPVCPADGQYVLGAPLFKKAIIHLENGATITINAPKNSAETRYVQTLKVNGKYWKKNWLHHQELIKGAVLDFGMSAAPNKTRGTGVADRPFSLSAAN